MKDTAIIYATRKTSQYGQLEQRMFVRVLEVYPTHMIVDSLNRHNGHYKDANKTKDGKAIRRINRDQANAIYVNNEKISWEELGGSNA